MPLNNSETRTALEALGWQTTDGSTLNVEGIMRTSYWFSNDEEKLGIHLLLVEDMTIAMTWPKLFIYTTTTGFREIKVEDLS